MSDGQSLEIWRLERTDDGIATLWFDQPGESHNLLNRAAFEQLDHSLSLVEKDGSTRGLLIRSAKPFGFCAGIDLKTIQGCSSEEELESFLQYGLEVTERLASLVIPTAAIVHGVCLGGGLELALACRSRVAIASQAPLQIGCPEVQFGLIPAWGAIVGLVRLLATRDALNLLLTGNPIGFLQAKSQGLVDKLVSQDEHDRIAEILTTTISRESPLSQETWADEANFAAAQAEESPGEFPDAQRTILDLIKLDLDEGREIALVEAVKRCTHLAFRPGTQQAIADFFQRRRVIPTSADAPGGLPEHPLSDWP
jgi:3-hydroxyacyl-CoA dehydrogenase/enoyl-CoA hydratase/3-hydroxybutyryl-CoA epimerase